MIYHHHRCLEAIRKTLPGVNFAAQYLYDDDCFSVLS